MYDIEIPWEPTNEVDKHTVAVMRSNSLVKESVVGHIPQNISKFSLMFLFFFFFFFFSIWVFLHERSLFTGQQGKGEGIFLTPLNHFHPLHRHLDISQAITAESSSLHIACNQTRTGNVWFPSASHYSLSYAPLKPRSYAPLMISLTLIEVEVVVKRLNHGGGYRLNMKS